MYISDIRSRVSRKFLLLSRVNQYDLFLKLFGVNFRGHCFESYFWTFDAFDAIDYSRFLHHNLKKT